MRDRRGSRLSPNVSNLGWRTYSRRPPWRVHWSRYERLWRFRWFGWKGRVRHPRSRR